MLETGVPNLDLLLGGGLPEGELLLVAGPTGSGKTTLTIQTAFHAASRGRNVLFSSGLSETPPKLLRHIETFGFYDAGPVGKRLFFLDLYPVVRLGLDKVTDVLIAAAEEHEATLLVVDGLTALLDRSSSPDADVGRFLYDLGAALHPLNCTIIVTSSRSEEPGHDAAFSVADGILKLGVERVSARTVRTIEPKKMRGMSSLEGKHALRIDGEGVAVCARVEARPLRADVGLSEERVPLGIPELDHMMMGGLPAGSVSGLAGAPGSGKTLVGLQYAMEGVRRGEQVMIAGFRETPPQLVDKAGLFGLQLERAVADRQVLLFHRPAVELVIDEVMDALLEQLERSQAVRLVIDGYEDMATAIPDERRRSYMAALAATLRDRGVTTLVTVDALQSAGQVDFGGLPLSLLAQNLVQLRSIDLQGALYRIISIQTMRDSAFDATIREYSITATGLTVRSADPDLQALLFGTRAPSGARSTYRAVEAAEW